MDATDDELVARAFAAYFRSAARTGQQRDQPSKGGDVIEHDERLYVVLTNSHRTLAVYRVRTSGQLKELRRWPREVAS